MLGKLGKFLGGGVAKPIRDIAGTFIAPRDVRAMNENEYKLEVLRQFIIESQREPTTWWTAFTQGLNQLPRPILALGTIGLIGIAVFDPGRATGAYGALTNVPQELWALLGIIVSFYMGGRLQIKALSAKQASQRLENMERTANLIMDMNERLDKRAEDKVD